MTDRVQNLLVHLDEPERDDDVESLINAIHLLRNVRSVDPVVWDMADLLTGQRVRLAEIQAAQGYHHNELRRLADELRDL